MTDLFPDYGVRELARLTGLSHGTISRVKRGLAADRQTMQTIYTVTGKCLCCDGIAKLSPTVSAPQPDPLGAEWTQDDSLHNAWMNYLHLHQAAYDVWRWFEVSRPDLIGPRAEALRDAVNGPRPYGSFGKATTETDLLAAALEVPQIKRLVEAVRCLEEMEFWVESAADNEIVLLSVGTFRAIRAAIAALKGGA